MKNLELRLREFKKELEGTLEIDRKNDDLKKYEEIFENNLQYFLTSKYESELYFYTATISSRELSFDIFYAKFEKEMILKISFSGWKITKTRLEILNKVYALIEKFNKVTNIGD